MQKAGLWAGTRETRMYIESKKIELIVQGTKKAVETYNKLCKTKKVVAALHLTC